MLSVRILAKKNITDFPFEVLAPGSNFSQQADEKLKNYNRILLIDDIFDTGQQLLESKKIECLTKTKFKTIPFQLPARPNTTNAATISFMFSLYCKFNQKYINF